MKNKILSRNIGTEKMSIRADEGTGKRYLEGYAIVFNQRSKLIREWGETFYEVIEPGAVDNVLRNSGINVIATIDHDRSRMLARTKSGTLQLIKDERGLKYIIELPNTSLGNDIAEQVARGDYFESSFIFTIAPKGVRYENSEDVPVRYVSDFENIYDVAVVIDGAYANTKVEVAARSWGIIYPGDPESGTEENTDDNETIQARSQHDILMKELEILKL